MSGRQDHLRGVPERAKQLQTGRLGHLDVEQQEGVNPTLLEEGRCVENPSETWRRTRGRRAHDVVLQDTDRRAARRRQSRAS